MHDFASKRNRPNSSFISKKCPAKVEFEGMPQNMEIFSMFSPEVECLRSRGRLLTFCFRQTTRRGLSTSLSQRNRQRTKKHKRTAWAQFSKNENHAQHGGNVLKVVQIAMTRDEIGYSRETLSKEMKEITYLALATAGRGGFSLASLGKA